MCVCVVLAHSWCVYVYVCNVRVYAFVLYVFFLSFSCEIYRNHSIYPLFSIRNYEF